MLEHKFGELFGIRGLETWDHMDHLGETTAKDEKTVESLRPWKVCDEVTR